MCRSLETLRLRRCGTLRDCVFPASLRRLCLHECQDAAAAVLPCLPRLRQLQSLSICGTDAGRDWQLPDSITELTALTELRLARQPVRDEHVERTICRCTALQVLDLSGTGVAEDTAHHLTTLTALTSLDLSWTSARYPPPLPRLRSLCMDACTLGGDWGVLYTLLWSAAESSLEPLARLERLSLLEIDISEPMVCPGARAHARHRRDCSVLQSPAGAMAAMREGLRRCGARRGADRCMQLDDTCLPALLLGARHTLRRVELCLRADLACTHGHAVNLLADCEKLEHLVDVGRFIRADSFGLRSTGHPYAALGRLTRLAFTDEVRVTDVCMATLGALPALRAVSIQGHTEGVTDSGVAALARRGRLSELVLQAASVTGGDAFGWASLGGLRALQLWSLRMRADRVATAAADACPDLTRLMLCGAPPWECGARAARALASMRNMQHATFFTEDASAFARRLCAGDEPPRLRVLELLPPRHTPCMVGPAWPDFSAWADARGCVVSTALAAFASPPFSAGGVHWEDELPARCGERGSGVGRPHHSATWLDVLNNIDEARACGRWEERRLHLARGMLEHHGDMLQREVAVQSAAAAMAEAPVIRYKAATLLRLREAMGGVEGAAAGKRLPSALSRRAW